MDSDGSNAFQLTDTPENEGHPHISTDGSKIIFWSERILNREIWMMNSDGTEQNQLTNNPANDGGANWSPDGRKIVFRSDRTGNNDLWILTFIDTNLSHLLLLLL
jgi:TolB protein